MTMTTNNNKQLSLLVSFLIGTIVFFNEARTGVVHGQTTFQEVDSIITINNNNNDDEEQDSFPPYFDLSDLIEDEDSSNGTSYTFKEDQQQDGDDEGSNNGDTITPEIIGGSQVFTPGTYPWFTWLLEFRLDGKFYSAGCGAALISKEYLLTAAHCIKPNTKSRGYAWIGFLANTSTNNGQARQLIKIRDVFIHPSYNPSLFDNDFALIRLGSYATLMSPANIDSENLSESYPSGKKLWTMGMGCRTVDRTGFPSALHHVELTYITNDQCTSSPYRWAPSTMTKNKFCAHGGGTKAACNGDSGSAMYDTTNGVIVGVTSYGYANNPVERFVPPVFARVSAQFSNWIKPTLCTNSNFSTKPSWCETNPAPTDSPTKAPTDSPTKSPTDSPTKTPSSSPVESPTDSPTQSRSWNPSTRPVVDPTIPPNPSPTPPTPTPPTPTPPTGTKTHSPTICTMNYELKLMTDRYGQEISWEIAYAETGEVVVASSSSSSSSAGGGVGYPSSTTIIESGCLPFNCYAFTIRDSFGDGLCCGHGDGSYSLTVNDNVVGKGGEFKTREKTLFGTCRPIH